MNQTEGSPAIKKAWLRVLLMLLSFLVATVIIQGILFVVYSQIQGISFMELQQKIESGNNLSFRLITEVFSFIIALGVTLIYRKYIDRKSLFSLGFDIKVKDMVWGFFTGFILIGFGFVILRLSHNLQVVSMAYSNDAVLGSLLFFVMVGIAEELIFRGYVLNNLMEGLKNKYLALLISSLLFALVHGLNPNLSILAMVNLVLAGLALGITYIHTKNLWFPVFLHISWNYFQGPIFGFEVSGTNTAKLIEHSVTGNEIITGGKFGFEGSVILTIILIVFVFVADFYLKKKPLQIVS